MNLFWAWVSNVVSIALPPVLVSSLAGSWDLWYVWAYAGILGILFVFNLLALQSRHPDLLKERMKPPSGKAYWSGVIFPIVQIIVQPVVAGLDHRYHWSDVLPPAVIIAGLVIVAAGMSVVIWAELINPFFSGAVRIQEDRGQRVVSDGPYRIVRHPAYAGGMAALLAGGLALNSLASIVPALVLQLPVLIFRAGIEDQMLRNELPGYAEYASRVRHRLIPGIW